MLSSFGRADGVFGMHRVWQRDIHSVDGGIVCDLVEVLVAVYGACRNLVLGCDALRFVAMPTDQCSDLGVGGVAHSGHEMAGDAAKTDDGVANLLLGLLRIKGWHKVSGETKSTQP